MTTYARTTLSPRKPRALPPRQREALVAIVGYRRRHGYSPTCEELGEIMGTRKVAAYEFVKALRRRGLLAPGHERRARWMEPTQAGLALVPDRRFTVPLGTISAKGVRW